MPWGVQPKLLPSPVVSKTTLLRWGNSPVSCVTVLTHLLICRIYSCLMMFLSQILPCFPLILHPVGLITKGYGPPGAEACVGGVGTGHSRGRWWLQPWGRREFFFLCVYLGWAKMFQFFSFHVHSTDKGRGTSLDEHQVGGGYGWSCRRPCGDLAQRDAAMWHLDTPGGRSSWPLSGASDNSHPFSKRGDLAKQSCKNSVCCFCQFTWSQGK